jgi:hypothetical protein
MPEPYAEQYQVAISIHLDANQWSAVVGPDPIRGVAGFGSTVNAAMADLVIEMEHDHRTWQEFAEPD